jgi:hypothetical protein
MGSLFECACRFDHSEHLGLGINDDCGSEGPIDEPVGWVFFFFWGINRFKKQAGKAVVQIHDGLSNSVAF